MNSKSSFLLAIPPSTVAAISDPASIIPDKFNFANPIITIAIIITTAPIQIVFNVSLAIPSSLLPTNKFTKLIFQFPTIITALYCEVL